MTYRPSCARDDHAGSRADWTLATASDRSDRRLDHFIPVEQMSHIQVTPEAHAVRTTWRRWTRRVGQVPWAHLLASPDSVPRPGSGLPRPVAWADQTFLTQTPADGERNLGRHRLLLPGYTQI